MRDSTLLALIGTARDGRASVRAIDLGSGDEHLINPADDRTPLGRAAAYAARRDRSETIELDGRSWFLEVHNPALDLRIVGAVHIGQSLARFAAVAGYRVTVIDPRETFATRERFPDVVLCCDWPDAALADIPLGPRSALVVLSHDPKIDDPALKVAMRTSCFYIGALGSRKSHAGRLDRLGREGFAESDLARIHGPVGLAIGARTPAEIAISILAEMTLRLRADGGWEHSSARATADTGAAPRS
ncbi:MAG TPA: XdhC family protein [Rhizomicrobium sp.]|jgi:xanthine dehydrogenase accessory factor